MPEMIVCSAAMATINCLATQVKDRLNGGEGADRLSGGSGADRFIYNKPTEGGDKVVYFSTTDYFVFEGSGFGLGDFSGPLNAINFRSRKDNLAQDGDDLFIFRKTDDTLWFDSDGTGAELPTLIADISNDIIMTHRDILIA